ncbi:MAG TPA: hypothetical protein VF244_10005, partial [Acidimicrobiales bacterium]
GAGPAAALLGVGGDELQPVVVDLADLGGTFVVAGPGRSGRSTALATLVRSLAGRGADGLPIVLVTPRPSPLRDLAGLPGVVAVLSTAEEIAGLGELLDELAPLAVVVDDAELLADGPPAVELGRLVRTCRDSGSVLVAAGTTDDLLSSRYRGWLADARRPRSGLLLCPATATDGELFDLRLPRSAGAGWPPGRGLLVDRGRPSLVQVARP